MGHAEELFVDPGAVSAKLRCPICLMVQEDAVFHLQCQNGFCKGCLSRVASCPCCRRPLQADVFSDITRRELVLELDVRCPFAQATEAGDAPSVSASDSVASCAPCEWRGRLDQLAGHLEQCRAERAGTRCQHCGVSVAQKALARHERRCAKVKLECALCGVRVPSRDLPSHVASCPALRVACPHACGATQCVAELGGHLKTCPNAPVRCSYHMYGCHAVLPAAEMVRHIPTCSAALHHPLFRRCKVLEATVLDLHSKLLLEASETALGCGLEESRLAIESATQLDMTMPLDAAPRGSDTGSDSDSAGNCPPSHPPLPSSSTPRARRSRSLPASTTPGRLVWRIRNFAHRAERYIESASFPDAAGDMWTCRLYPTGDGNTHGFITFGAYKTTDTRSKYSVEILNPNPAHSIVRSIAPTESRWRTAGWGWRRLIRRERVVKGFLDTAGTLVIAVQVTAAHEL